MQGIFVRSPFPMQQSIDPRIFRAYDIRGRADTQLSDYAYRMIGQAFGSEVRKRTGKDSPRICIGRDARTHSPAFEQAAIEGLLASGCTVLQIGAVPSPVNYFTICEFGLDGGTHVTASHNPGHDNGIKFCLAGADSFAGNDIQILRKRIEENDMMEGKGTLETLDATSTYIKKVTDIFKGVGEGLTVAVDSGNGIAGPINTEILRNVGANVIGLYIEPMGDFPNHLADPSKHETLKDLQKAVMDNKADIGIAFDGDGDRAGLVDETGTIRNSDQTLLLLAIDHLSRHPGASVVHTVSASGILKSEIERLGGKPVMCKVGHSNVEHAMQDSHSLLGGETSGHLFCGEGYYHFDDACVAALRLITILKNGGKPLSAHFADFPKTYQMPPLRPYTPDDVKGKIVADSIEHFSKKYPTETMDGARIDFGNNAWAGIRQSNTSPCIDLCVEARTPEKMEEVKAEVMEFLKAYPQIDWDKH